MQMRMYHPSDFSVSGNNTHPNQLTQENLAKLSSIMVEIDQMRNTSKVSAKMPPTDLLTQTSQRISSHNDPSQSEKEDSDRADHSERSSSTVTDLQEWVLIDKKGERGLHMDAVGTVSPHCEKRLKTGKYTTDRLSVEEGRNIKKSKPETLNRGSTPRTVHPLHSGLDGTLMTREDSVSRIRSRHCLATESMSDVLMNLGSQFPESRPPPSLGAAGDWVVV